MNLQENISRIKEVMGLITEGLHDTSWENVEGDKITLIDLLNATEDIPVQEISVEELKPHLLSWDGDEEEIEKIEKADLQYPILIFLDNGGEFISIIDGHHRAQKAVRKGLETINAKVIPINSLPKNIRKVFGHMGKQEQNESEITERCWKGYTQKGMKTMFGKRYPNCVKKESVNESVNDGKITCDNCGWKWRLADGGKDMYICHECGSDNTPSDLPQINKEIPLGKKLLVFKYWDRKGVKLDKLIQNFSQLNFGDLRRLVVEYYGGIESFNKHLEEEFKGKVFTCQDCNWGDLTFKFKVMSATLDIDSDTGYIEGIYFVTETLSGVYEDGSGKKYSVVKVLDDYDHDLQQDLSSSVTDNTKEYLEENFTYPQYGMGVTYVEMY